MNPRVHRWLLLAVTVTATFVISVSCSKKKTAQDEETTEEAAPVDPSVPAPVIAMIEAHGGMAAWRTAKTVSFESEFAGPGDSTSIVTRVMVDQLRRRAYIDFPKTGESMAWDGKRAWSVNWKQPYPPRFAALLDYYFLNLPWLTMDPGVKLTVAGNDSLWEDPTRYRAVTMSFRPGTGDTPGDRYQLYLDPETRRLKAFKYVMTYRSMMPDSMDAMPEHVVVYDDFGRVDGLLVPTRYSLYRMDHSLIGTCEIRDWSLDRPFDEKKMTMPDTAVVDESKP